MVKKREGSSQKGFILLIVIAVLILIVQLISLNVLYNISKNSISNFGGELATYEPSIYYSRLNECIQEECDSSEDCGNVYDDAYNDAYQLCIQDRTQYGDSYGYYGEQISYADIVYCQNEAENSASDAVSACYDVRGWCVSNCLDLYAYP